MRPVFRLAATVTKVISLTLISGVVLPAQTSTRHLAQLPLAFEKHGDGFLAHGQGYIAGLVSGKAIIHLVTAQKSDISLQFMGSRDVRAAPEAELPGKINYIRGNNPKQWQIGIPTYERVTYPEAYPGIDLVYHGNQRQMEFDLVVKPGSDTRRIRMKIGGPSQLSIDTSGALKIGGADALRFDVPAVYQMVNGARKTIRGHYELFGRDEVGFTLDSYDHARTLVIDPTIVYSTIFGGDLVFGSQSPSGIQLDASGNILIAGSTTALDFPTVNAAQSAYSTNEASDAFITKINPAGTALIYSTYLGGTSESVANGLAVDANGAAWITGFTQAIDFPVLNAAQSTLGSSGENAFVAKLNASGVLQFSTYLGGSAGDLGEGITTDSAGNAYVTGYGSGTFPTTAGVLQTSNQGVNDAFVVKYSSTGSVIYSTLLGGTGNDFGYGITVDSSGNAYIAGYSTSSAFTGAPAGGAQQTNQGDGDAFVAKLNATGTALLYFTFLGGAGLDSAGPILLDSSLNAYMGGHTQSAGIATAGAAQTTLDGMADGFVAKLNAAGTAFDYVTYIGGLRSDSVSGLALDGSGNVYVTGSTDSNDFPTVSAVEPSFPGGGVTLAGSTNSGASWSAFDANIPGAVFDVSLSPAGTSGVVLTENGVYRTVNNGTSWTPQLARPFGNPGSYLSRSPAAQATIYAILSQEIYRSTDDGVTWSLAGTGNTPAEAFGLLADPLTANTVYFFGNASANVYFSINAGVTWRTVQTGGLVTSVVATTDGSLYAGTSNGIFKSINQGSSWGAVNTGLPAGAGALYAHSLSASGTTVYFAYGTIYKTTNGGANWTATTGGISAYEVAASPQDASVLYAYDTNNEVQASADGGATWSASGPGLPANASYTYSALSVDPSNSAHVLAVTGSYQSNLPTNYPVPTINETAFVAKLNSTGSSLLWSTYLGGITTTYGSRITTDGSGDVFVTGSTSGQGFPMTASTLPPSPTGIFLTEIKDATNLCSVALNPGNQIVTGAAQTLTFSVLSPSGCAWSASSSQPWAVVSTASGIATGIVIIQVTENAASTTRSATLTVGSQNVTITQAAGTCVFSVDQSNYSAPSGGGTVSPVLTATAGCPWVVTNPFPNAISITSGASGTGNGTIGLTVAPNPGFLARTFVVPVGSTQIEIDQAAALMPQTISFNPIPNVTLLQSVGVNAMASSGLNVVYTSNTPAVCTVPANALQYSPITLLMSGTCSITASQPGNTFFAAAAPVTQSFTISAAAGPIPQPTGGIANAASASQATPSVVSPGSYVAIYGTALAGAGNPSATSLPLPNTLNGAQVSLGGLPMPLNYASATQINALIPEGLAPNASYPLVVTVGSTPSAPVQLNVIGLQPAIYTVNELGTGPGIVANAFTGQLNTASNPAHASDFLTVYCTGLGPLQGPNGEPEPADGVAAPLSPTFTTKATVTATIGGVSAPVSFAGLTATLVGLYQVNVQVPAGVTPGNAVPLVLVATEPSSGIANPEISQRFKQKAV
jgi:uncharacterized protein (TIGR03437 family)